MKVAEVQFAHWDKIYYFSLNNLDLEVGDMVIIDTELGMELGKIVGFADVDKSSFVSEKKEKSKEKEAKNEDKTKENDGGDEKAEGKKVLKPIIRKATKEDLGKMPGYKERRDALVYCKKMIAKRELEMKLIDVNFSFSGNRITFAFIADGRVDFRELVKDLTSHFNKLIRLTQIGVRDEAKLMGDFGHCGRQLCCRKFIKDFTSITSEMTEVQQVTHRGSERLSGICGRLMCCLSYEYDGYQKLAEKMPDIGQKVNVDGKKGTVINCHVLKQTVDVEFDNGKEGKVVVEVDLDRHKK